ncbi:MULTISPECIES: peptide methionine sulfoxide reductase [Maribacter]|uniref:Peptide methionine sulfoxide reductase n=1 Tax=Maribacter flavus TaxID=1658664 RepID=A0ABU7IJR3_9FLAO|nr:MULTISPECIES: peptide methionine sulfoxide reductase [Maribacter]MDC6405702.1 peptide methionine sulfoxide reductase [Maribacter sp. PR66]MEE1973046.1 peptide methionine sulfoxide reductase [Maribacter flavus]
MDFQKFPEGYSTGMYRGKKYGISKTTFNKGKSFKLYAEELGGSDFISMNFYSTKEKELLKPCEMPEAKVVDFLNKVKLLNQMES